MERNKTKEQLEEEKKISLSFRIKPLEIDNLGAENLRTKAQELWETIVRLETEKYDLEERQKRQDYDLKELKERQKQQLRHKALKKGLDPEALTGKYPVRLDRLLFHVLETDDFNLFSQRFKSPPNMKDVLTPAHMTTRRNSSKV